MGKDIDDHVIHKEFSFSKKLKRTYWRISTYRFEYVLPNVGHKLRKNMKKFSGRIKRYFHKAASNIHKQFNRK